MDKGSDCPISCSLFLRSKPHDSRIDRRGDKRLIKNFIVAATILRESGIDAVELNAHGGYLIDQFLTPCWNRRTDQYGGSLEGRLRFLLEVVEGIKRACGSDLPIIVKYGLTHYLEGGREVEEGLEIARRLEGAGVDALCIDAGSYETLTGSSPPSSSHPCVLHRFPR